MCLPQSTPSGPRSRGRLLTHAEPGPGVCLRHGPSPAPACCETPGSRPEHRHLLGLRGAGRPRPLPTPHSTRQDQPQQVCSVTGINSKYAFRFHTLATEELPQSGRAGQASSGQGLPSSRFAVQRRTGAAGGQLGHGAGRTQEPGEAPRAAWPSLLRITSSRRDGREGRRCTQPPSAPRAPWPRVLQDSTSVDQPPGLALHFPRWTRLGGAGPLYDFLGSALSP